MRFSKNGALLFVSMLLLIGHLAKAEVIDALTTKDPAKDYSFGKELLTKVLEVIDRDDIKTYISLDLKFNGANEIKSFESTSIQIDFGFKKELNDGFTVPFSYQDSSQNKQQKKLASMLKIQGDSIRARVELSATKAIGEFSGSIQFYVQKAQANILTPVLIKVENSIIVVAEYELFSAQIKLKIPLESKVDSSTSVNSDQIKKELSEGTINCVANSRKQSLINGKSASSPLSECLFTFNGDGLKRIALKDGIELFKPVEK